MVNGVNSRGRQREENFRDKLRGMRNVFSVLGLFCLFGCGTQDSYDEAIASATQVTEISEFQSMFPESVQFITHYTQQAGNTSWNSIAGLHGRYTLTMQFP